MLFAIGLQPPLAVKVKVTVPAAVSALLGMYVAFKVFAFGEKIPLPEVVHVPVPVEEVALRETLSLLAQTVWFVPALTVGVLV